MTARSKAWAWDCSLAGIAGSNPAGIMDVCPLWALCVVSYRSLRRADHSSRGVLPIWCVCDLETSTMRKPRPTRAVDTWGRGGYWTLALLVKTPVYLICISFHLVVLLALLSSKWNRKGNFILSRCCKCVKILNFLCLIISWTKLCNSL